MDQQQGSRGGPRTRRELLKEAGTVAAGATLMSVPAGSGALARRDRRKQTVAIFGGGIAGLTAAHELIERGFDVTVYERRAWGGKARSTTVPHTGRGGRKDLPSEHAFRGEFGCYENLSNTMRRIPFRSNPNGVFDNMVGVDAVTFFRTEKRDISPPLFSVDPRAYTPEQLIDTIVGIALQFEIPPAAAAYFAQKMAVYVSSCADRRLSEIEPIPWTEFIATERFGQDYRRTLGAIPELTQASKAEQTSAKYVAWFFEYWVLYPLLGRGTNGAVLRMLNGPTNDAWIDPWIELLRKRGARLRLDHEVLRLGVDRGQIAGAELRTHHGRRRVKADWYVCALPVERARRLWNRQILDVDPKLARMHHLGITLMNGLMFYLRDQPSLPDAGACADSPWSLGFVPQARLWEGDFTERYGDGSVREKISVSIANFDAPGVLFGKSARKCTPGQLARDCWAQIKQHVNNVGAAPTLTDEMLHSWNLDPGLKRRHGQFVSEDPLILPRAGTERYRPDVSTGLRNLTLCGDYLNGEWEVTNMEAASFNGRRAANAVLDESRSREEPSRTILPYRPPEWEPLRKVDEDRYRRGQPNLFDADPNFEQVAALLANPGG